MLDEETVAEEGGVSVLEEEVTALDEDSMALESVVASLESESVVTLELLSSPHAEIKIPDINTKQELRNVLPEKIFIKCSFCGSRGTIKLAK